MIYLILFLAAYVLEKYVLYRFMQTQMNWQKTQDEMILKLLDARKRDLEREIAHLGSGNINNPDLVTTNFDKI